MRRENMSWKGIKDLKEFSFPIIKDTSNEGTRTTISSRQCT